MAASGHAPGSAVVGVTISFTVLAFMATVMRLYTRIGIVRNAGLDDIVITIALALTIVLTVTMCQQGELEPTFNYDAAGKLTYISTIRHGKTRGHTLQQRQRPIPRLVLGVRCVST